MELEEASTVLELYDLYLAEKDTSNQSEARGRLLTALYRTNLSIGGGKGNPARQVMKIIQEVRPTSAGENYFPEYVALFVKHAPNFSHLFRQVDDASRVNRVLEAILLQNSSIRNIEALVQCNSLSAVEDCLHTTFITYMFFLGVSDITDEDLSRVKFISCDILASIQTTNGKLFAKYLRCFLVWYFEDDSVNSKSKSLVKSYLRSSPDLLPASTYTDLISLFTEVVVECLAMRKSLITKAHCESLIKKILELIPLSVSIETISKSFFSSKVSRIRLSAIGFLVVMIRNLCQIRLSNSSNTPAALDSSGIYDDQLDEAIREVYAGRTQEATNTELDSMIKRSMAYVLDAGKLMLWSQLDILNANESFPSYARSSRSCSI
jgi:hypothetical protein